MSTEVTNIRVPVTAKDKFVSKFKMKAQLDKRRAMDHDMECHGRCLTCINMYRDLAGPMCGIASKGLGHVIKRPSEEGCRDWKPRKDFQPAVFEKLEHNLAFAQKVRAIEYAAKTGLPLNPVSFL